MGFAGLLAWIDGIFESYGCSGSLQVQFEVQFSDAACVVTVSVAVAPAVFRCSFRCSFQVPGRRSRAE